MEKAIQKALSVGYKVKDGFKQNILLDKDFWSALGKAEGWEEKIEYRIEIGTLTQSNGEEDTTDYTWKYHWHKFIDHIAMGGDIESFFNNLIK